MHPEWETAQNESGCKSQGRQEQGRQEKGRQEKGLSVSSAILFA